MVEAMDQFVQARQVFHRLAFGQGPDGDRLPQDVCRVFDAATSEDDDHNCLACVLNDLLNDVAHYLDVVVEIGEPFVGGDKSPLGFRQFVSLLNTFWEVVRDAFKLIKLDQSYFEDSAFPAFTEIRRWTNFFKHPGPFGYKMHHPDFVHEGTSERVASATSADDAVVCVIASKEVFENWQSEDPRKGKQNVLKLLGDKKSALVILPDVSELAGALEREIEAVTDILCSPPFARRLSDESTIEEYFCWGPDDVRV